MVLTDRVPRTGSVRTASGPEGSSAKDSLFGAAVPPDPIRLVGPGTASLLVTIEVPVGLTLAGLVLGDRLAPPQLAGAGLVIGAIALLQMPNTLLARLAMPVTAVRGRMLDARAARLALETASG